MQRRGGDPLERFSLSACHRPDRCRHASIAYEAPGDPVPECYTTSEGSIGARYIALMVVPNVRGIRDCGPLFSLAVPHYSRRYPFWSWSGSLATCSGLPVHRQLPVVAWIRSDSVSPTPSIR